MMSTDANKYKYPFYVYISSGSCVCCSEVWFYSKGEIVGICTWAKNCQGGWWHQKITV